ncbi:MAG: twin-arginine translocase TatA/TatE family subunit [Dehalococcoidia bacterium]|nr:twin-arginine translocase TatA/TatE family subunit [Dehalococcoidia bacterium]
MGFVPSGPEVWVILVIILIVFGAGKLPEIGGALGKGIREFRVSQKQAGEEDGEEDGEDGEAEDMPATAQVDEQAEAAAEQSVATPEKKTA